MADETYSEPDQSESETLSDDTLFLKLRGWFRDDRRHWSDWRRDAREDYAFVAGDQWEMEDKAFLEEQGRPMVTFNRIGPIIDSVAGLEVSNRQEVRYMPREQGDVGVNEVLTGAGEWARDECDAEDEESDAFQDACICGIGATETRPDYIEDPEGKIVVDRLDPLDCVIDRGATKKNFADRKHHFYVRKMPLAEAQQMFPEADDEDLHAAWATLEFEETEPHDATPQRAYNQGDQGDGGKSRDEVSIVYCEWWEPEQFYRVLVEAPGMEPMRRDVDAKREVDAFQARAAQMAGMGIPIGFRVVEGKRRAYKQAFLGSKVLETGPGRCKDGFSINFITGKRDRNEGTFYGLVRVMKDPQRWANKFFSTALHDLNTGGKGIIAEANAFENWREAEEDWTSYDRIVKAAPGAISGGKIMPKPSPTAQPQIANLMQYAISSIRDVSGVNLELLGMTDRNQPGVLEYQRKQAGMTILATLFDSLRRYRKIQGRVMLYLIQEYISDGRLIRITGPQGARYVPLVRDPQVAQYDVVVDEAAASPNLKERTWAILSQMTPIISNLGMPPTMWAEILRYSPLPNSLTEKLSQMLIEGQEAQIPEQVQAYVEDLTKNMQKLQEELARTKQQNVELKLNKDAEIVSLESQRQIKERELALKEWEANLEGKIAVLELQIKGAEAAQKLFGDAQKAEQEFEIGEARLAMERSKYDLEMGERIRAIKADAESETIEEVAELRNHGGLLASSVEAVAQAAQALTAAAEQMSKPKRIVRDDKGRALGVETVGDEENA